MVDYAHNPAGVKSVLQAVDEIYDKVAVVITVTSESERKEILKFLKMRLEMWIISFQHHMTAGRQQTSSFPLQGKERGIMT